MIWKNSKKLFFLGENFRFDFMAISDDRQRSMPSMADRDNAKQLAYKEAVLLTNPQNPMFKGEVYILYRPL